MMRIILVSVMLLAVGVAAMPSASASCANGDVVDCWREARDFLFAQECFNGPIDDRIDHWCWGP